MLTVRWKRKQKEVGYWQDAHTHIFFWCVVSALTQHCPLGSPRQVLFHCPAAWSSLGVQVGWLPLQLQWDPHQSEPIKSPLDKYISLAPMNALGKGEWPSFKSLTVFPWSWGWGVDRMEVAPIKVEQKMFVGSLRQEELPLLLDPNLQE